jgi:hypothetical protein
MDDTENDGMETQQITSSWVKGIWTGCVETKVPADDMPA